MAKNFNPGFCKIVIKKKREVMRTALVSAISFAGNNSNKIPKKDVIVNNEEKTKAYKEDACEEEAYRQQLDKINGAIAEQRRHKIYYNSKEMRLAELASYENGKLMLAALNNLIEDEIPEETRQMYFNQIADMELDILKAMTNWQNENEASNEETIDEFNNWLDYVVKEKDRLNSTMSLADKDGSDILLQDYMKNNPDDSYCKILDSTLYKLHNIVRLNMSHYLF